MKIKLDDFQNEPVAAWVGYVVIVTDNKIRLRHP
jgi:hypothetical protein